MPELLRQRSQICPPGVASTGPDPQPGTVGHSSHRLLCMPMLTLSEFPLMGAAMQAPREERLDTMKINPSRSTKRLICLLLTVALALPLAVGLDVALLAAPARAEQPPIEECDSDGYTKPEVLADGTTVYWICYLYLKPNGKIHRYWKVGPIVPGRTRKAVNKASADPQWYSRLNVALGDGKTMLTAVVSYQLYTADATAAMSRDIQARLLIVNTSNGSNCGDTGWIGPGVASRFTIERSKRCGSSGYYEVRGAGRFWSLGYQTWISTGWVSSGTMYFSVVT
jgi:hypothetical protein